MKKKLYSLLLKTTLFFMPLAAFAQPSPISLRGDVTVQFIMNVHHLADRVAKDPATGNLFYTTSDGNVYEIKNLNTSPYDTLLYTTATHGIDFLQGMTFIDSSLFLIGNHLIDSTLNTGLVKKAVLQPSGIRTWVNVATTATYAQSHTYYDHGFSGIVASPDLSALYINSGSRTDHGEEQNNYGMYPGLREEPLTSAIFRIPANSVNLTLPNTVSGLAPYLYADGVRNSFDLAFDSNNNLFATENSGDRDDPDELNWIRQGHNYGFPWKLGGDNNPQQFPGYVANNDALLNHHSNCYLHNYYHNDPTFPSSSGITFTAGIKNLGPDADRYREPSGQINDGSNSGNFISSFSPHRSPLGLAFDRNHILASDLNGDGFLMSFTIGGDSAGLDPYGNIGALCDPGEDLLHIKLTLDSTGEYEMHATTIVKNFLNPVDSYLDSNILYIIEYAYSGNGRLFKVTLPLSPLGINENSTTSQITISPNPSTNIFTIHTSSKNILSKICVYDLLGNCVMDKKVLTDGVIDLSGKAKGIYFVKVEMEGSFDQPGMTEMKKIILQ